MTVTPRNGTPLVSHASYGYDATFSVDGLAEAEGDSVRIDRYGWLTPFMMLAAIIVSFVVAVVASWKYRSRRKQLPRKRK
jgi:amino acid transporter